MIVTALGIVEISLLYDFSHTLFFLFSVVQFSRTKLAVFCRQLFYYTTKFSVCQVLFKKFFDFFLAFFQGPPLLRFRPLPDSLSPVVFPAPFQAQLSPCPPPERLSNISLFISFVNRFLPLFSPFLHVSVCFSNI